MSYECSFPEFKTKHGLSYSDLCKMTGKTMEEIRGYSFGKPVPKEIAELIHGIDIIVDRLKTEKQVFTNNDAWHAAHIIGLQNKEIKRLMGLLDIYSNHKIQHETNYIENVEPEVIKAIDHFASQSPH